ncbi:hypothetical protein Are01nite_67010 [Actinoplanes regularis]|nr:hypothetical protein Are01nite_67010 [Actinoplanes regularis]
MAGLTRIVNNPTHVWVSIRHELDRCLELIVDNHANNKHDPVTRTTPPQRFREENPPMPSTATGKTRGNRLAGLVVAICWLVVLSAP